MVKKDIKNPSVYKTIKHTVHLEVSIDDSLVQLSEFVDYIKSNLKVNGNKGALGEDIVVSANGTKQVMVTSRVRLAKRYIKYLTKKFLKKIGISDYIKINATEKSVYRLKYIAVEKTKEN